MLIRPNFSRGTLGAILLLCFLSIVKCALFEVSINNTEAPDVSAGSERSILEYLATGYVAAVGDRLRVRRQNGLKVHGRTYWYGALNDTERRPTKTECVYYVEENSMHPPWNVVDENGAPIRSVVFQCNSEDQFCCRLECCADVYTSCYVVLALAGIVLLAAIVLGIFIKFGDQLILIMFHFKFQRLKRKKIEQLLKADDANYMPAED